MENKFTPLNITVKNAGSLRNLISSYNFDSLSISGPLNGTDFKAIRDLKDLEYLDLSKCKFVGGGRSYTINDSGEKIRCIAKANELSDYQLVHMEGCKEYKQVLLPEGLSRIGKYALAGHNALETITIPDSVVEIDDSAFFCCCGLTHIKLGKNLKKINDNAFCFLHSLTELEIPASVEEIGKASFFTKKLEILKVLNPTPPILHMDLFDVSGLSKYKALNNVKIKPIKTNPFNTRSCKLIVPKGSLTRYKKALGWKDFKNIVVE